MMQGITVQGVTKHFGATRALEDVTLTFAPNRIYGWLVTRRATVKE
ncbi:MAG: hypothetical protein PUC32_02020 [Oscillospiraceae bacterium]|nr:hypothetical protein [Oscillospiraceae bacterium]